MNGKFSKKKNLKRHVDASSNRIRIKWFWVLVIAVIALLFCTAFVLYQYKKKSLQPAFFSYYAKANAWIESHKKKKLHSKKENHQAMATTQERSEPEPIHFEFYKMLPNMQLASSAQEVNTISEAGAAKKPSTPISPQNAKNASYVEAEIAHQLKKKIYILQLGVFQNYAAAEKYRKLLLGSKIPVNIIKMAHGKSQSYRVQAGPYPTLMQAKAMQKKVQKLGVASLVRGVEIG